MNLPTLSFLPVKDLLIHERHDKQRTRPLMLRIKNSGVWRNPPVVAPFQDGTGRYMVLDGANRITCLQEMGYPHALVQVSQPGDPGLSLRNWNHVVWEMNPDRFMSAVRRVKGARLTPCEPDTLPDLWGNCGLALVKSCRGHTYSVCTDLEDLGARVDQLNALVDSYKERARLDRTSSRDISDLVEVYPQFSGLVIFPRFQLKEVMDLAGRGYLLPAGITRFTISPRALHINYRLEHLAADRPLEAKNEELQAWIQERLERKGVRYYAEATVLFDE